MTNPYKIALCQMSVTADKEQNFQRAARLAEDAARGGARVVCLPEIWNSPYDMKKLGAYAEPEDGPSVSFMSELARKHGIILVGGSIPESARGVGGPIPASTGGKDVSAANAGNRVYNTAFVFDRSGNVIAKHRKVHLFDIGIEKGIRFKESDFFAAGSGLTVFDTELGRMGLAICFDLRFPEMFREMAALGAGLVFLPASFNMTTGPVHWDILLKGRALDNQFYLAACASARSLAASYTSWGHSCVATPWGEYCGAADARETIVYADIDTDYMRKIRSELPVGNQ